MRPLAPEPVPIGDEILPQDTYLFCGGGGAIVELGGGSDGMPVAPHGLCHGCSFTYLGDAFIVFNRQHQCDSLLVTIS